MGIVFVRTTGNDGTGTGTYQNPYRTPLGAITAGVVVANTIVDIGVGTFDAAGTALTVGVSHVTFRGQGANKTQLLNTRFNITNSATVDILIRDLAIQSPVNTGNVLNGAATNQQIRMMRVAVNSQSAASYTDPTQCAVNADGSSLISLFNCTFFCVTRRTANLIAFAKTGTGLCHLINCIVSQYRNVTFFDGTNFAAIDAEYNCYNDVAVWVGNESTSTDVSNFQADPQLVAPLTYNYTLNINSPCVDAGIDLTTVNSDANPLGPEDYWGWSGSAPDMGAEELLIPNSRRPMMVYNMHFLLMIFAQELQLVSNDRDLVKTMRMLSTAGSDALRDRFGAFMHVYKPLVDDLPTFRLLMQAAVALATISPAIGVISSICQQLFGVTPYVEDYFLRILARLTNGAFATNGLSYTNVETVVMGRGIFYAGGGYYVVPIAGRFFFNNEWFNIQSKDVASGILGVSVAGDTFPELWYSDGTVSPAGSNYPVIKKTTDLTQQYNPAIYPLGFVESISGTPVGRAFGRRGNKFASAQIGTPNGINYTADMMEGTAGNGIQVQHVQAGNNTPLTVVVNSGTRQITVNLATGGGGAITSTVAQVIAAVIAAPGATAMVDPLLVGSGAALATASGYVTLAGARNGAMRLIDEQVRDNGFRIFIPSTGFSNLNPANDDRVPLFEQMVRDATPIYQRVVYKFTNDLNFKKVFAY